MEAFAPDKWARRVLATRYQPPEQPEWSEFEPTTPLLYLLYRIPGGNDARHKNDVVVVTQTVNVMAIEILRFDNQGGYLTLPELQTLAKKVFQNASGLSLTVTQVQRGHAIADEVVPLKLSHGLWRNSLQWWQDAGRTMFALLKTDKGPVIRPTATPHFDQTNWFPTFARVKEDEAMAKRMQP